MVSVFVICPACCARVDLPDDGMEDLWKVTSCDDCGAGFGYDPEDIQQEGMNPSNAGDAPSA